MAETREMTLYRCDHCRGMFGCKIAAQNPSGSNAGFLGIVACVQDQDVQNPELIVCDKKVIRARSVKVKPGK